MSFFFFVVKFACLNRKPAYLHNIVFGALFYLWPFIQQKVKRHFASLWRNCTPWKLKQKNKTKNIYLSLRSLFVSPSDHICDHTRFFDYVYFVHTLYMFKCITQENSMNQCLQDCKGFQRKKDCDQILRKSINLPQLGRSTLVAKQLLCTQHSCASQHCCLDPSPFPFNKR